MLSDMVAVELIAVIADRLVACSVVLLSTDSTAAVRSGTQFHARVYNKDLGTGSDAVSHR